MRGSKLAAKPAERGRPLWGFCRIKVETICRLWVGYREGELDRTDVQVWFAAHELLMRRCTMSRGRRPAFSQAELLPLTGLPASTIRAAIRRLERAGLLSWSEHQLDIKDGAEGMLAALTGLPAILASVVNHRRTLPIPRHTVLLLARTRRPVVLATLLGHLLRGVYYRSGGCVSWGTCKASWIADTFGVDVRNVKSARKELEALGWMRPLESHHWHRQRYGGSFVVSLAWDSRERRSVPERAASVSPPRKRAYVPKTPPPESYRNLPTEGNYQKRASARLAGVQGQKIKPEGAPSLVHVVPADLVNPWRTAELFRQATAVGLVQNHWGDRLQFFAAAQRARRLGSNPGGFFITLVRERLWRNLSNSDEEAARRHLAQMPEFFYGQSGQSTTRARTQVVHDDVKKHAAPIETDRAAIRELVSCSLASVEPQQQNEPLSGLVRNVPFGARRGVTVEL